jgi:NAD(P)-dependent dehydrogenase (short-subunit alcohol dehydrogenase family)
VPRAINEQVVVVTGASSGNGRETALEFAQSGARVVLAARREDLLRELADEIRRGGGEAHVVPTDVTDNLQVEHLARAAQERFGGIDTWVNAAAVTIYSRLERITAEEFRRVVEVDLLGVVHGTMAAVPIMRARGGGVIINVSSVLGKRAVPYQSPYCASKFGIVGFSESIRAELVRERISVCTVVPSSINTPLFDHARSKEGYRPKPIGLVYDPSLVAHAIVRCAERPRREVVVGRAGWILLGLDAAAPSLLDRVLARLGKPMQFTKEPDRGVGNLFEPVSEGTGSRDGWSRLARRSGR